jgi:hypothetical protein
MADIATAEQRLKMQMGELLFSNHVAGAQVDMLLVENATLRAKIAELEAAAAEKAEPEEGAAEPAPPTG